MKLIDHVIGFSIRSRIFVFGGAATLLGLGLWALSSIPFEAFPDITANSVSVITEAPGLAPQEVEQLVTFPIERAKARHPRVTVKRFGEYQVTGSAGNTYTVRCERRNGVKVELWDNLRGTFARKSSAGAKKAPLLGR